MSFYDNCGNDKPLSIIAGPCVFESKDHAVEMATALKEKCNIVGQKFDREINFIYKTSFDKANRSSADSYRSAGFDEAFYGMQAVRARGIEVLTDVHDAWQCEQVQADIIQIPAFLCRQTDLIRAAAESGCAAAPAPARAAAAAHVRRLFGRAVGGARGARLHCAVLPAVL